MQPFFQNKCLPYTFSEFKEKFGVLQPENILWSHEKYKKNDFLSFPETKEVSDLLFSMWTGISKNSLIKDYLHYQLVDLVVSNDNLYLTQRIRLKSDCMDLLFQKVSKNNLDSQEIFSICTEFSANLLICFEIFYFRCFLIKSILNVQEFSFLRFSYLQLLLLIDGEYYLFLVKIIEFVEIFSKNYKI